MRVKLGVLEMITVEKSLLKPYKSCLTGVPGISFQKGVRRLIISFNSGVFDMNRLENHW